MLSLGQIRRVSGGSERNSGSGCRRFRPITRSFEKCCSALSGCASKKVLLGATVRRCLLFRHCPDRLLDLYDCSGNAGITHLYGVSADPSISAFAQEGIWVESAEMNKTCLHLNRGIFVLALVCLGLACLIP